jgi:hypothetical protein
VHRQAGSRMTSLSGCQWQTAAGRRAGRLPEAGCLAELEVGTGRLADSSRQAHRQRGLAALQLETFLRHASVHEPAQQYPEPWASHFSWSNISADQGAGMCSLWGGGGRH